MLGDGPDAAPAVVGVLNDLGLGLMATLVFVEDAADEISQQALTFAANLGQDVSAVPVQDTYAPAAWAEAIMNRIEQASPDVVVAPGTDRGNEVLAHVAAMLDQPMAANCVAFTAGDPATVTRVRWGGSLLEEARVHAAPVLLTVAPHAVAAAAPDVAIESLTSNLDGAVAVRERVPTVTAGVSLESADVVVSGGRGVGSAEGFVIIEELAGLLGGAVGCSRAVTSAGWRPHTDQVGPDGDQDLARDLHRVRDQRGHPAHGRMQGGQEAPGHQPGRRGVDLRQRRLRRDRRPARGGPGDLGRDQEGARDIGTVIAAVALAAAIAISGTLFIRRVLFLTGIVRAAPAVDRSDEPGHRARNEVTIVLGQRKLLQRFGPGLMHAFIFWGFLVLLPTILIALIGAVDKHDTLPWLGHQGWFAFLVDLFAVLVLVGVLGALYIRKVQRPRRFQGSHLGEADLILAMIATIATTLLLWHATRIALGLNEWPAADAPVSNLLSHLFADDQATRVLERVFVWLHVLTILTFLAYLPRSKHLHIATAAINVWFGGTGPGGRLEPLRFDDPDVPEEEIRFGAGTAAI